MPHVRQRSIQPNHVAREQIELILLELFLHLFLLIRLHLDWFSHLAGLARIFAHHRCRSPLFQLHRAICLRYAFQVIVPVVYVV